MKKLTSVLFCFIVMNTIKAQENVWNLSVSTDTKILLLGSDNKFTKHNGVGNIMVFGEYIDKKRNSYQNVFFGGFEYANLSKKYYNFFFGYGAKFDISKRWYIIPSLESTFISRERTPVDKYDDRPNGWSIGIGSSIDLRWQPIKSIDNLHLTIRFNAEQASDIEGRLIRWQFTEGLVYTF